MGAPPQGARRKIRARRLPRGKNQREERRQEASAWASARSVSQVISIFNGFRNTEQAEGGRRRC